MPSTDDREPANEAPSAVEATSEGTDLRPVIAIFSEDVKTVTASRSIDPDVKAALLAYETMIPASYVNWIGQAGARVLPVRLRQPAEYYQEVFDLTNGLVLPGGNQGIDPDDIYTEEGAILYKLAKEANDRGDYYPIWGTCLGFEELAVLETGNGKVISQNVVATNLSLPLRLSPGAESSRLFGGMPTDVVQALQSQSITFNSHGHGLLVSEFESNPALHRFFEMLSSNQAPAGMVFVSSMEARNYPFYGVQWHPEKNNWEWSQNSAYSNIPHSEMAIRTSVATADFLVGEARKSSHTFPESERGRLVYSAPLIYTGPHGWTYEQVYVFE